MHGMSILARICAALEPLLPRQRGIPMIHRIIGVSARLAQITVNLPAMGASVSKAARGLLTTAQHTLSLFGLSAVAMLALLYTNEDLAKRASELLHPHPAAVAAAPVADPALDFATETKPTMLPQDAKALGNSKQQRWVTSWLSKRYRVAGDAADMLVSTAYLTAHETKLDPLLILAVMAIESGLNPFAESPMGAKGLMQVMANVHHDKFKEVGGPQAALNPVTNIRVGAHILKDYVTRSGSIEGGLKTYVGAAEFESDSGYGSIVLVEYRRLKQVATGKKVPTSTPPPAPTAQTVTSKAPKIEIPPRHAESLAGL